MVALPEYTSPTVQAIYKRYEQEQSLAKDRAHLGASQIGQACDRALWYGFRWALRSQFEGRMLRLFERGQREEDIFVRELRAIGIEVHNIDPETGSQYTFSDIGGHFGGSMDGAALGILEAKKTFHVLEFKTHNNKSFNELKKKGVEQAKPEHYLQMQCYMHWSTMERAFYLAVNKDTDQLYAERIKYDMAKALAVIAKAKRIIEAKEPPAKLSSDPAYYRCKWCDYWHICHGRKLPRVTCRSCAHATAETDGDARWSCAYHNRDLAYDEQQAGCGDHLYIPALVAQLAQVIDASPDNNTVTYQTPSGVTFRNGTVDDDTMAASGVYTSDEMRAGAANNDFEAWGDKEVLEFRRRCGARITGSEAAA